MKSKSIMQGLVGPHILFTAAYLLFSAEVCTSSAKHKPRSGIGNRYVVTPQVKQTNKIEAIIYHEDASNDLSQLDQVQDGLAIDSEQGYQSFGADTTILSVEPSADSIAKDASKASVVDTTSKQEHNQNKEGSTRGVGDFRPSPDLLLKDACSVIPIDSEVLPKRPERRPRKSTLPVMVEKDGSNSRLSSKEVGDLNTFVPPPPSPLPSKDNSLPSSNRVGDGHTFVPPPPPLLPNISNSRSSSNEVGDNNKPVNKIEEKGLEKQPKDPRSDLLQAIQKGIKLRKVAEEELAKKPIQDPRSNLLQAIRDGVKLRKVEKQSEQEPLNTNANNDLASILARRIAIEYFHSSSGSESESDGDWSDDHSNDY